MFSRTCIALVVSVAAAGCSAPPPEPPAHEAVCAAVWLDRSNEVLREGDFVVLDYGLRNCGSQPLSVGSRTECGTTPAVPLTFTDADGTYVWDPAREDRTPAKVMGGPILACAPIPLAPSAAIHHQLAWNGTVRDLVCNTAETAEGTRTDCIPQDRFLGAGNVGIQVTHEHRVDGVTRAWTAHTHLRIVSR